MYRIGICDDDKVFCASLEEQIYGIARELRIQADIDVWYSGESLIRSLEQGMQLDLIFLDIEMSRKNGIITGDYIRNERQDMQTHIVYISSKESYAMQLFKVQPLDFLIKPVSADPLKEVLLRSVRQKRSGDVCFEYQKGSLVVRVPLRDIRYFMSADKKIVIAKKDGQEVFYGKLNRIEEQLPADFMRIHQSYIIHHAYVSEYSYEYVKLIGGETLNISRPYRKETRSRIRQFQKAGRENVVL